MSKNSELERQNLFVEWLKARGMYNVYDSSATMRKTHDVWEEQQKLINELNEQILAAKKDAVLLFRKELVASVSALFRPHINGVCGVILNKMGINISCEEVDPELLGENNDR